MSIGAVDLLNARPHQPGELEQADAGGDRPRRESVTQRIRGAVLEMEDSWRLRECGLRWCGDWHTHPNQSEPQPSNGDRRGWEGCIRSSLGFYVGVIATADPDVADWEWCSPRLRAWVAERGEGAGVSIRPVAIA